MRMALGFLVLLLIAPSASSQQTFSTAGDSTSIDRVEPVVEERDWPRDPNRTQLAFGPTARSLGAGDVYVASYYGVVPFVGVGLTERISVAGGTVLAPGAFGRIWYAAPRATLHEGERVAVAVGAIVGATFLNDEFTAAPDNPVVAGIGYAVTTLGSEDRAATVGLGWGAFDGGVGNGLVVMLGGEYRLGRSVKLLTENYLVPSERAVAFMAGNPYIAGDPQDIHLEAYEVSTRYEPALGLGARFFGEHLALDLMLMTVPGWIDSDYENWPVTPLVGLSYSF